MVAKTAFNKQDIYNLLSQICDPEIPVVSIEEMGILRNVIISDEECIVEITPTYTGCPAMSLIQSEILATLHQHNVPNPKVITSYTPAWTTDWMSHSTKEKLKKYGIAAPIHSSCMDWDNPRKVTVECPRCQSNKTKLVSHFGSTACKALYVCEDCKEPFDYFKCH